MKWMYANLKKLFQRYKKTVLFFVLIALVAFFGVNYLVKYTSNKKCYRNIENVPACGVGIILGTGVHGDKPNEYLEDRLETAVRLYKAGKVNKLLLTGDNGRVDYDELRVMKLYCYRNGVDSTNIYLDYAGFDTYSSLYRAKHIFNVEKAIIVSQNYHIDRAVFIGNRLGVDCYGFAADVKGNYNNYRDNVVREYAAVAKSALDLMIKRKPKYMGDVVDINGVSNYTK